MTSPHALPPDADDWLADHPDLDRAALEEPWRAAAGADPLYRAPTPDPERIARIRAELERRAAHSALPLRRVRQPVRTWPWLAAAACVALLVAVGLYRALQPVTIIAPPGEVATVALPDGSSAELNSGSSITYGRRFGRATRTVRLNGEAFFDVVTSETPFVVETFNAGVTVRGTSFNVRAWPDDRDAQTVVAVVTGVVEVAGRRAPDRPVSLQAGETTRVAVAAPMPVAPSLSNPDRLAIAWRTGGFFFEDQSFGAIFDEVERRYDIAIHADDAIRSRRQTFSKHQAEGAEAFLDDFCAAVGLRYRPTADGFEVFSE